MKQIYLQLINYEHDQYVHFSYLLLSLGSPSDALASTERTSEAPTFWISGAYSSRLHGTEEDVAARFTQKGSTDQISHSTWNTASQTGPGTRPPQTLPLPVRLSLRWFPLILKIKVCMIARAGWSKTSWKSKKRFLQTICPKFWMSSLKGSCLM